MDKLFKEAAKIVSLKKLLPFFSILALGTILMFLLSIRESTKTNKDFFNVKLEGRINEIYEEQKESFFLIDSNWYVIKDEMINIICVGDSILKNDSSYIIIIKDNINNKIKFQEDVKSIIFEEVNLNDID